MSKKLTTEQFIEKSIQIYGNKYDYSKVNYINSYTKVCIICPEHGEFWQLSGSHLRGCGCTECGKMLIQEEHNRRIEKSKRKFYKKAHQIYGDKYDYSKVNYVSSNTKVCIICPEHGEFWQTPNVHIHSKYGCPKCSAYNIGLIHTKYTKEIAIKLSKKYKNKKELRENNYGLWCFISKNKLIEEACSHMEKLGNHAKRYIYAYEFEIDSKKYVYVGLSYNVKKRHVQHKTSIKSSVYQFCKKYDIKLHKPIILTDLVPKDIAGEIEKSKLEEYIKEGWISISKIKCGGLGGNKGFEATYEEVCKIASKYKHRLEWSKNNAASFNYARKMGWIDAIMPSKVFRYKDNETALKEALKYSKVSEMLDKDSALYNYLHSHNLWGQIANNMGINKNNYIKRKIVCLDLNGDIIKMYKSRKEAINDTGIAYETLKKYCSNTIILNNNVWLYYDDYTKINDIKEYIDKCYDNWICQLDLYTNKIIKMFPNAISVENELCIGHTGSISSYLRKDKIAILYNFKWCYKKNLDYAMKFIVCLKNRWTKEKCVEESKKYTTRGDFKKICGSAYNVSRKNGWLNEMTWLSSKRKN